MHAWRVTRNPQTDIEQHAVLSGLGHALLAPVVANIFETLGLSAALWEHGLEWKVIHTEPTLMSFEFEHGKETSRYAYNERHLATALRQKNAVRGELAGLSDFFVPIVIQGHVAAILVAGPFWLSPPTTAGVLERWWWLTGRHAHPADSEFASYLSATLSTLVLDPDQVRAFEKLLRCLAELMAGEGQADRLTNQAEALSATLKAARFSERAWQVVRQMVDERTSKTSLSLGNDAQLRRLGLPRIPDAVLVGLCKSREPGADPVDEIVRRHAFQRSSVELAQKLGELLVGQVGDHGVVFVSSASGSMPAKWRKLHDVAERAFSRARTKFGLSVYWGACVASRPTLFSRTYEAALGAAESALTDGKKFVTAETESLPSQHTLRDFRRELGRLVVTRPDLLSARFDRYIDAVGTRCGYRLEPARGQLEAGFERMAEPLLGNGSLDEKSYGALGELLDRSAGDARTVSELFAAYRRAMADLREAINNPTLSRQDRTLRRALDYIHQHYTEPLPLQQVARLSGLSGDYFSKLFKRRERMTFEHYVRALRLERSKQLLGGTQLGVARVGELSGFSSPQYFSTVFRTAVGATPLEYRLRSQPEQRESQAIKHKQKPGKSKGKNPTIR